MQLNLKTVPLDEVIGNGDLISHKVHRHEPPVTNLPIEVVHASKDMLAISKPGGISIHPSGNYNHNTVTRVLMHEGWATDGSDSCRLEPGFSLKRKKKGEEIKGRYMFGDKVPVLLLHLSNAPIFHTHKSQACNRLDRLTSGLVLIALNRETAVAIQKEFVSRTIKKTYICRVKGEFPE